MYIYLRVIRTIKDYSRERRRVIRAITIIRYTAITLDSEKERKKERKRERERERKSPSGISMVKHTAVAKK